MAVGYRRRQLASAHDAADAGVFDHHRAIVVEHRAVKDVVGGDREFHFALTLNNYLKVQQLS
jgi:hypothetical protein